ncbi:MAG: AraC family transcriptional regulator [Vallitaleaceae bacterium]|jgi:AraC family transcriptional regulator|nr:AraC family transcriptional regulator [Vallitaleaceae bacterium]
MAVTIFESVERISNMLDIQLIEYGLSCGSDWHYKDLRAPYSRLYIILEGEAIILIDKETIHLKQGNAYIIPSNMNFSCYTPNHMKKLYVHFSCKQWMHTNLFDKIHEVLTRPILVQTYEPFIQMLESENIKDYWTVKGHILWLIYQFIGNLDLDLFDDMNDNRTPELISLYQILKRGVSAKTRTCDLAAQMKMSQSMLSKLYKSATGMSLKSYIQQQIIEQAQMLLISTNKSIKEIASDLQYQDALYFTRVFHQWVGESPTSYRTRNRMVK